MREVQPENNMSLSVLRCVVFWLLATIATRSSAIPHSPSGYVEWCYLDPLSNGQYVSFSPGGESASFKVAAGSFVKPTCNPGYHLVGEDKLKCGTDGNLLQQAICEDINECNIFSTVVDANESPSYSIESSVVEDNEPNLIQDLPIDSGYPCPAPATCVNNDGSFICQYRGKPSTFIQCGVVTIPEHGKIIEQSQVHVTFMCNVGHRLIGSDKRLCIDGNWSGIQPSCEVLTCMLPQSTIEYGWSNIDENRTYSYGNEVQYCCNQGYRLVGGNSKRVCTTTSSFEVDSTTWSGQLPSCQVIQCPNPGRISNGQALVTSRNIGGDVSFRCNPGFQLLGSAVRDCQDNGKWSGTLTTCNDPETFCPTPGIPFNGRVTTSTNYNLDDVITFECNYGYDLIGSRERHCTSFGQWSGEQPVCRAPGEYDDIDVIGEQLVEDAKRYREEFETQNKPKGTPTHHLAAVNPLFSVGRGRTGNIERTKPKKGGRDVYFVFDVSKSVRMGDNPMYIKAINFAKALVEKEGVSPTGAAGTRYGAIAYASEAAIMFHLTLSTKDMIYRSLDGIEDIVNGNAEITLGDGTATAIALRMVHEHLIPQSLTSPQLRAIRSDTDKILFLLTDGQSNMKGSPEEEANKLKTDFEVVINCIGIGSEVNRGELNRIASEPENNIEHVFLLDEHNLSDLTAIVRSTEIDYSGCGESRGPQNTNTTTAEDVWPWQAGIYTYEEGSSGLPSFFCGGSLIAPNWILSAAHCFDPKENRKHLNRDKPEKLVVIMGTNKRVVDASHENREQRRYVNRTIIHPKYNSATIPKYDYDIALLELNEPFELGSFVRTVCLPPSSNWSKLLKPGEQNKPFATGWGKLNYEDTDEYVDDLKQLALPIRRKDDAYCRVREWEKYGNLTQRMFCAGYADGSLDSCTGDSGGPLVRKWLPQASDGAVTSSEWRERWYQVGIVSWGPEVCAQEKHYGYYTHLPRLIKWVKNVMLGEGSTRMSPPSPGDDEDVVDGGGGGGSAGDGTGNNPI